MNYVCVCVCVGVGYQLKFGQRGMLQIYIHWFYVWS